MSAPDAVRVAQLRVDDRSEPIGTPLAPPGFSWKLETARSNVRQADYRIAVRDASGRPMWDSGPVASTRSNHVVYAGLPLAGRTRYHWNVEVTTVDGERAISGSSWWETGITQADWRARWITYIEPDEVSEPPLPEASPSPYLRREFELVAAPSQARLYVTSLGLYEARLNGRRIGSQLLTPGWTDYKRRIQAQTFDVTAMLVEGANALGIVLADGWYAGHVGFFGRWCYGDGPLCLAQLEAELENGDSIVVATDDSWRGSTGPVRAADLIMGERVDYRFAEPGWDQAGFDDSHWRSVQRRAGSGGVVLPQVGGEVEVVARLEPRSIDARGDAFIVDFGQNLAGRVTLDDIITTGTVTVRHAEMLDPDGGLYTANLRSACQRDEYEVSSSNQEQLAPRFTYHGFRFAEVRGVARLRPGSIRAEAMSSALRRTGTFTCSNELLNRLHQNIVWGQLSNFVSVPTDCPQRDERLGWTGDVLAFAATAAFNFDVLPFFRKWLVDLDDAQHPSGAYPDIAPTAAWTGTGNAGWAEAGVIVPWTLYRCYGDERLLADRYEGMQRFLRFLERDSTGQIRNAGRYGDWVALGPHTPKELIGTAYYAAVATTMSGIARALGRERDAAEYGALYNAVRAAFQQRFISDEGVVAGETQTGYLLALAWGLVPDDLRAAAVGHLVEDIEEKERLTTGFLGTPIALPVLSDSGHHELACRLVERVEFPSWGFSVKQGATTIWERWDGWTPAGGFKDPSMNSFNHYALGAVGDWLHRYVAGLEIADDGAGYSHAVLRPRPGGSLTGATVEFDSVRGRFVVGWQLFDDDFRLTATVPPNSVADVVLPFPDDSGATTYRVGSGTHAFTATRLARERNPEPLT